MEREKEEKFKKVILEELVTGNPVIWNEFIKRDSESAADAMIKCLDIVIKNKNDK